MRTAAALLLLALSLIAPARAGCDVDADLRPLRLRWPELALAFVGTVRAVDGHGVRFEVEQALRGAPGREFVARPVAAACSHRFQPGERWLFAGAALREPSRRLGDAALPLARHLSRLDDDQHLGLSAWQGCDESSQCVAIDHGCTLTAAHRDHREAASRQAWARGGDPRDVSCASQPVVDTVPACVDRRCGAWQLTPTRP